MGGSHSKSAFTNDLQTDTSEPDGESTDCFTCLFPSKSKTSPAISSRHSSRHGLSSRNNSGTALNDDGGFGTPIPDTPEPIRRIRDAAFDKYYSGRDSYEEEKKSSGGSFGRTSGGYGQHARGGSEGGNGGSFEKYTIDGSPYTRSSKYGGLEKEESGMFPNEQQQQRGGGGGYARQRQSCAEIYDGHVSLLFSVEFCCCV